MKKLFENWRGYLDEEDTTSDVSAVTRILDIKANIKTADLSYVLGTIDGQIIAKHNESKLMYGASSSKPILALANLIKCEQESGRCLTHDELLALLTYTKEGKNLWHRGDSNKVNRALSAARPKASDRKDGTAAAMKKAAEELANFKNNKEASDFLAAMGLPDMMIRYGSANNKQTTLGYYNFMRIVLSPDDALMSGLSAAAKKVLSYMRREYGATDREQLARMNAHRDYLRKRGLSVNEIYGKGGYYNKANNSSMIIDDNYILIVYAKKLPDIKFGNIEGESDTDKQSRKKKIRWKNIKKKKTDINNLSEVIYQILTQSGVY